MPLISVIIPTYKHRDFVLTSLESVFAQTFTDHEVIVVNDGSPDDTGELLKPLSASGKIRYIEQANQGQAAARNRGLAEAKGKFIAFLDDDDLWPKDKLSWQLEVLLKDPTIGVVAGIAEVIDESEKPLGTSQRLGEIRFCDLFSGNPIISPGQTMIRADLLLEIGGMNNRIWGCDDWDLWFRASAKARLIIFDRVGLRYRLHPGNAGNNMDRMLQNSIMVLETHLRALSGQERRACAREGWHIVSGNFGRPLIKVIKEKIASGDARAVFAAIRQLRPFVRPSLRDPRILGGFGIELLPRFAREVFNRRIRGQQQSKRQKAGWAPSPVISTSERA